MRIGQHDDNYLLIESDSGVVDYPPLRVAAVATASGRRFTASHDRLLMASDEATIQRFAQFEDLKSEEVEITLSESGWIRLQRDSHGWITVRYRIGGWKASAAMEGEVIVEGEFAGGFCREFGRLLRGKK
jgi:hypothetical protein